MGKETIVEGKLANLDFKFDVLRDATMTLEDKSGKKAVLINIKGARPEIQGDYEKYVVVPPRRVLVVTMNGFKMDFMVEGKLDEKQSYMDADGFCVVFQGEDGQTYTVSYGVYSETAVFYRG